MAKNIWIFIMILVIILLSMIILISRCDLPWEIVRVENMADQKQRALETPEITTSKLGTDMDTEVKTQNKPEPIKPQETELKPDNPQQPIKENQPPVIDASKFSIVSIPGLVWSIKPMDLEIEIIYIVTPWVEDPDGDKLTYKWKITGESYSIPGDFAALNKKELYWSPSVEGEYLLTLHVSDGFGGEATESIHVFARDPKNNP
jgi:hypothetical protein